MKEYKKTLIITSIVTLLPILIGLALWDKLPNEIATHFDMNGNPNGWTSKPFTVFGIPLFLLVGQWVAMAITLQDPKRKNMSGTLLKMVLWIMPIVSWIVVIASYGYELGYSTSEPTWGYALLGVMFLFVGNYLPKCRQNYTMGIKLPWTLHDEENWNHTHRMAGYLWMICGLLLIANVIFKWTWIVGVVIFLAGFVPTIYSYLYYRKYGLNKED